jgi:uncharacterized damage-inducible protein DinB
MMIEHLCNQLATQRIQTLARISQAPEGWLFLQPGGLVNHPAWTLAHLHLADQLVLLSLGQSTLDIELMEHFGPGSRPAQEKAAWTRFFSSRDDAVTKVREGHTRALAVVRALPAESVNQPTPHEPSRDSFPKIGDLLAYMLWHEGYHAGQVSQWRRAAGVVGANVPVTGAGMPL